MNAKNKWQEAAPQVIFEAYPDHDVLPIEPPKPGETISQFAYRAENAGDTLFLFLCREADEEIDAHVYMARLNRAIEDIQSVRDAFRENLNAGLCDSKPDKRDVTLRLTLDNDWIELSLTYADARGRRTGSVTSSLHSSETDDGQFNTAMHAVESMILAQACAGMDVTDPRYVDGIRTCVEACANNMEGGDA